MEKKGAPGVVFAAFECTVEGGRDGDHVAVFSGAGLLAVGDESR